MRAEAGRRQRGRMSEPGRRSDTAVSWLRFAAATCWNATSSITLHSVSKLRLSLALVNISGHYARGYAWK